MPQTAVCFDTGDELVYFIVDEDWEQFAGVDLADDDVDPELRSAFAKCVYSGTSKRFRHETVDHSEFHNAAVGGMNIIVCGDST